MVPAQECGGNYTINPALYLAALSGCCIDTFGLEQAIVYQTGMRLRFDEMAAHPMFYNAVDHIKKGYWRSVFGAHSINYKIEKEGIEIVRILGRQDPNKALTEQSKYEEDKDVKTAIAYGVVHTMTNQWLAYL